VLTGGGEPLLYRDIRPLVWYIREMGLQLGIITNGTQSHRLSQDHWQQVSWVRVSVNDFPGWTHKIRIPLEHLRPDCVVGLSVIYGGYNEGMPFMHEVARLADRLNARYVRVLPNCTREHLELEEAHAIIDEVLSALGDPRFFHQDKRKAPPKSPVCHQSYFRPYLSEEPLTTTGRPGSVYPCDSVVLNNLQARFQPEYQLCAPEQITEYLERRLGPGFDARTRCKGCVFTGTVNMLDDWVRGKLKWPDTQPMEHEAFI
jgi:hypothetical protein